MAVCVISCVLDASAVIALFRREPGWEDVLKRLPGAALSTVNASEVIHKLVEKGVPLETAVFQLRRLRVDRVTFDDEQAAVTASLREPTRRRGISLGDRACLALAAIRNCTAITCDASWSELDVGVAVEQIR
jgi:PIN domain nuclease of toxin-antitoxin system